MPHALTVHRLWSDESQNCKFESHFRINLQLPSVSRIPEYLQTFLPCPIISKTTFSVSSTFSNRLHTLPICYKVEISLWTDKNLKSKANNTSSSSKLLTAIFCYTANCNKHILYISDGYWSEKIKEEIRSSEEIILAVAKRPNLH
jgi:hypothetical protein